MFYHNSKKPRARELRDEARLTKMGNKILIKPNHEAGEQISDFLLVSFFSSISSECSPRERGINSIYLESRS